MNARWIVLATMTLVLSGCTLPWQKAAVPEPTPTPSAVNTTDSTPSDKPSGVIIGGVEMAATRTVLENMMLANSLTTLVAGLRGAGLEATLNGNGPFTVFAPTNAAFEKLSTTTTTSLFKPANKAQLKALLENHVVSGAYNAADLKDGMKLRTVGGKTLTVQVRGSVVTVGGASVEVTDGQSQNGVIHTLTAVIETAQ